MNSAKLKGNCTEIASGGNVTQTVGDIEDKETWTEEMKRCYM